jgi:hypothetical protein
MFYYINIDKRTDRKKEFEDTWLPLCPEFQRHSAYYSTVPHKGSGVSHADAAEKGFAAGHKIVVVFEDDAIPTKYFNAAAFRDLLAEAESVYESFDTIYLGANAEYKHGTVDGFTISPNFIQVDPAERITTSIGMIYSVRSRQKLLEYKDRQIQSTPIPCDRFFSGKSWGPTAWTPLTSWITSIQLLDQRTSVSNNALPKTGHIPSKLYPISALTEKKYESPVSTNVEFRYDIVCISVFFPISSKASKEIYYKLAERNLSKAAAPFIIFTTEECKPVFLAMRPSHLPMTIYTLPCGSDNLPIDLPSKTWFRKEEYLIQSIIAQNHLHHRGVTPALLQLYLSKWWFVSLAKENGHVAPFMMWCDIGSHKEIDMKCNLSWWPAVYPLHTIVQQHRENYDRDPLIFFQRRSSSNLSPLTYNRANDSIITGGHIIGTSESWEYFISNFKQTIYNLKTITDRSFPWMYDEVAYYYYSQTNVSSCYIIPTWKSEIMSQNSILGWFPSFYFLCEHFGVSLPTKDTIEYVALPVVSAMTNPPKVTNVLFKAFRGKTFAGRQIRGR